MKTALTGSSLSANISSQVLTHLEQAIFSGDLGPQAHVPAERELAAELEASRGSVRTALLTLSEKGLVETRHGSGTVVAPLERWGFGVLPGYIRQALLQGEAEKVRSLVSEILQLRRMLVCEVLCCEPHRMQPGDLDGARKTLQAAWEARQDVRVFFRFDLEKNRRLFVAAGKLASMWLLNGIAEAYMDLATSFPATLNLPEEYLESHLALFTALEHNDSATARAVSLAFLTKHDKAVLEFFGENQAECSAATAHPGESR